MDSKNTYIIILKSHSKSYLNEHIDTAVTPFKI